MHGLGNDFVLLDMRDEPLELSSEQLRFLGDRRTGVGCDQILILEPSRSPGSAAEYRIFNQDGSEAEHCGNGVRCVAKYLYDRHAADEQMLVTIRGKAIELRCLPNGEIRVDMGAPILEPGDVPARFDERALRYEITVENDRYEIGVVSMGNPHAVFAVSDVDHAAVDRLGEALQHHKRFPQRVNVGFMQVETPDAIRLRVYERGAGETRACGTGACAAVVVGNLWQQLSDEVRVRLPGGELVVEWSGRPTDSVWMTGPATYVFGGTISI